MYYNRKKLFSKGVIKIESNNNYIFDNYIKMARGFRKEKKLNKALKFYKKANNLSIGKKDKELILDIALLYDELGFREMAKKKYKEAIEIDENFENAYYGLAVVYDEEEDYKRARKYYKKAIEINPNYDKAYFFLANILDEEGFKEEAIENYKKVIEINPKDLWAYANIGCILEELSRDEEALLYLKKALEIDKNQFKVLFNMGVVLNKLKRKEEAKKYYKKSIESNDTYPYSYLNLALLYKDEDIEETIRILSLGIENNPGEAFLYYNRGCHFLKNNEVENAIKDIRRSIQLDDFFIDYSKKDKELSEIWDEI